MNDETLDQELQLLFAATTIVVDPDGDVSAALLEEIIAEPTEVSAELSSPILDSPILDSEVIDSEVIELEAEPRSRARSLLLTAAIVSVICLLSFGAWNALQSNASPVISDDGVDDGQPQQGGAVESFVPPAGSILGSDVPLLTVVRGDEGRLPEIEKCIDFERSIPNRLPSGSFVRGYAFEQVDGFAVPVYVDTGGSTASCGPDVAGDGSWSAALAPLDAFERVRVDSQSGISGPDGATLEVEGFLSAEVTDIEIIEPVPATQTFVRVGDRFVVVAKNDGALPGIVPTIEVTFADGATLVLDEVDFSEQAVQVRCDLDCLPTKLRELSAEAADADLSAQAEALVDGELSQDEYDMAVASFTECAASISSVQIVLPGVFMEETPEAKAATICHYNHLHFVERARAWHNHAVLLDQDDNFEDQVVEEVAEVTSTTLLPEATPEAVELWPLQENLPAGTPSGVNRAGGRGVGLTNSTGELVEIDLATGDVVRTIATLDLEARMLGDLQLSHDGTAVFLSEIVEDSWFSCESSGGTILRIDLLNGQIEVIGKGSSPQVSPDGTKLAYLSASKCIPDPNAADFVLTVYDSVTVRDLANDEERTWTDASLRASIDNAELNPGESGDFGEAQLRALSWLDSDVLAIGAQRLDANEMAELATEPRKSARPETGSLHDVLGYSAELDAFIVREPVSGGVFSTASTFEFEQYGTADVAAFDATYENLAVVDGTTLHIDGRLVELSTNLQSFDW